MQKTFKKPLSKTQIEGLANTGMQYNLADNTLTFNEDNIKQAIETGGPVAELLKKYQIIDSNGFINSNYIHPQEPGFTQISPEVFMQAGDKFEINSVNSSPKLTRPIEKPKAIPPAKADIPLMVGMIFFTDSQRLSNIQSVPYTKILDFSITYMSGYALLVLARSLREQLNIPYEARLRVTLGNLNNLTAALKQNEKCIPSWVIKASETLEEQKNSLIFYKRHTDSLGLSRNISPAIINAIEIATGDLKLLEKDELVSQTFVGVGKTKKDDFKHFGAVIKNHKDQYFFVYKFEITRFSRSISCPWLDAYSQARRDKNRERYVEFGKDLTQQPLWQYRLAKVTPKTAVDTAPKPV